MAEVAHLEWVGKRPSLPSWVPPRASTVEAGIKKPFTSPLHAIGFYITVVLFAFVTLFPLLWVLKMSLISSSELFASPPTLLPESVSFKSLPRGSVPCSRGSSRRARQLEGPRRR